MKIYYIHSYRWCNVMNFPEQRCVFTLFVLIFIGAAFGDLGEGKSVWKKFNPLVPVDESQLFVYNTFPKDFLWGVGSSAFQTEGSWDRDGRGPSIWDNFTHNIGETTGTDTGDSYIFFEKDITALQELGVSYYQFSISWTRLFPDGIANNFNIEGLQYYNALISSLLDRKIMPVVTLYHWDLPLYIHEKYGGWKNESIIDLFNDYATFCFHMFGDRVKYWITIHNPFLIAWNGYYKGQHAPGERDDLTTVYNVAHHLIKAHAKVWHTYNDKFRPSQRGFISIVLGSHWIQPQVRGVNERQITEKCQQSINEMLGWFAQPIFGDGEYPNIFKNESFMKIPTLTPDEKNYVKGTADFFALSFGPNNFNKLQNAQGLQESHYIRPILNWIKLEYNSPRILIAENGWCTISYVSTVNTIAMYSMKLFISDVLQAMKYDGVDVFGYTAWSLLDGFEWELANTIRRGLFYIDFNSKEKDRLPKSTALFYKEIIRSNSIPQISYSKTSQGQFPCNFNWGVADSVLQAELRPSSPQFNDHNVYIWNITGDGMLHKVDGVYVKTRPAQCTDFSSIGKHLKLLKKMKVTHYKFALNWSLILPNGDLSVTNKEVLRYYRCMISELLLVNITSMVTLYHPTNLSLGLPVPLLKNGGWLNRSITHQFYAYANVCFQELGDLVKFWITLNEPNKMSLNTRNSNETYQMVHNMLIAHALAWHNYDKNYRPHQHGQVSLALYADWFEPANPFAKEDYKAAERRQEFDISWVADPVFKTGDYPKSMREYITSKYKRGVSESFLPQFTEDEKRLLKRTADFYALNHFTTRLVSHVYKTGSTQRDDSDSVLLKDMTWVTSPAGFSVVPWGIRKLLKWIKVNYGNKDIYLTASGVDDRNSTNDILRKYYLKKYVNEILTAFQNDHVNIKGYYAWKLSNTFIGFFLPPYAESKAKQSVEVYNKIISDNGFPAENSVNACHFPEQGSCSLFCEFLVEKKPLLFFGFCLLFALVLLVMIIHLHRKKKESPY
ncbi:beta-klotho [Protopterus annectens]|uniref:beta-klotho n=1 Tax=Protopterus annectens TaxID=7888 RepID=UPI001CF974A9|nr:beta-klotho [Protopterus annectens]